MKKLSKSDREYWTKEKEVEELEKMFGKKFEKFFAKMLKEYDKKENN